MEKENNENVLDIVFDNKMGNHDDGPMLAMKSPKEYEKLNSNSLINDCKTNTLFTIIIFHGKTTKKQSFMDSGFFSHREYIVNKT